MAHLLRYGLPHSFDMTFEKEKRDVLGSVNFSAEV